MIERSPRLGTSAPWSGIPALQTIVRPQPMANDSRNEGSRLECGRGSCNAWTDAC